MAAKHLEMQVLKRGRQTKRSVELHPDATVQDILMKLEALSGISSKHLFVAEQRHVYKVRLFGLERPEGNFQVGGLENMEMLPDVIHVEHKVELSVDEALELLKDLQEIYQKAAIQSKLSELQQSFIKEKRDVRKYGFQADEVVQSDRQSVFEKWNFGSVTDMNVAFIKADADERVMAKQKEIFALLGLDLTWVPKPGTGQ